MTTEQLPHEERVRWLAEQEGRCNGGSYGCLLDIELEGLSVVENCPCAGTGRVALFPMLRQECGCLNDDGEGVCASCWDRLHSHATPRHNYTCESCIGRGWVPDLSLEALLDTARQHFPNFSIRHRSSGHILAENFGREDRDDFEASIPCPSPHAGTPHQCPIAHAKSLGAALGLALVKATRARREAKA